MMEWGQAGTIRAGGKELECASWGPAPGDAPTLVLLHEGLGSVAGWQDFPVQLAEATGFGVFAYSRAGYGQSETIELPRPLNYMELEAKDVLPDVLNAAGIQRCILLGHSDGGTIAATYAGSVFDPRVRGIALIAPHFFHEVEGLEEIRRAREAYDTGDLRARLSKQHADVDAAFRGWSDSWLHPDNRDWDISDVIDHIRVPVLAMQGTEDAYGSAVQLNVIEDRSYAPVEIVWFDGIGHQVHRKAGPALCAAVAEFCNRIEAFESA